MWKDTRITGVLQEKELKPSPAAKRKWNSTPQVKSEGSISQALASPVSNTYAHFAHKE